MKTLIHLAILLASVNSALALEFGLYTDKQGLGAIAELEAKADRVIACDRDRNFDLGLGPTLEGARRPIVLKYEDIASFLKKEKHKELVVVKFDKTVMALNPAGIVDATGEATARMREAGYKRVVVIGAHASGVRYLADTDPAGLTERSFALEWEGKKLDQGILGTKAVQKQLLMELPVAPQGIDFDSAGKLALSSWASLETPWEGDSTLFIRYWEKPNAFVDLARLKYNARREDDDLKKGSLTFYIGDIAIDHTGDVYFAKPNYSPGRIYKVDHGNRKNVTVVKECDTVRALEIAPFDQENIYALNPEGITIFDKVSGIRDKGRPFIKVSGEFIQLSSFAFVTKDVLLLSVALGDPADQSWNSARHALLEVDSQKRGYYLVSQEPFGDIDTKPGDQGRFYSLPPLDKKVVEVRYK